MLKSGQPSSYATFAALLKTHGIRALYIMCSAGFLYCRTVLCAVNWNYLAWTDNGLLKGLPRHLQTRTEEKPLLICIFTGRLGALQHIAGPLPFSNRVRLVALWWGMTVIIVTCLKEPSLKFMEEKHQTYSSCQTVTPTMEILWLRYINLLTEVDIECAQVGNCRSRFKSRLVLFVSVHFRPAHDTATDTEWQLPEIVLTQFVSADDEHDVLETCRVLKIKTNTQKRIVRHVGHLPRIRH